MPLVAVLNLDPRFRGDDGLGVGPLDEASNKRAWNFQAPFSCFAVAAGAAGLTGQESDR